MDTFVTRLLFLCVLQSDVMLRVTSTAICGSDLHLYLNAMPGKRPTRHVILRPTWADLQSSWNKLRHEASFDAMSFDGILLQV